MPKVLIIGVGNPLRGDDGLAWQALAELDRWPGLGTVEMISCHQLTPELAEAVSGADRVIFIDARVGETPGRVELNKVEPEAPAHSAFSHRLDPPALLGYAERLYGKRPEAFTASVAGESFRYGEELSGTVRASLAILLPKVIQLADGGEGPEAPAEGTGTRLQGISSIRHRAPGAGCCPLIPKKVLGFFVIAWYIWFV